MDRKADFSGKLEFIGIGDLIQLLGSTGCTGILRLSSPYAPEPGIVHFQDGNPIEAQVRSQSGVKALNSLFGWLDGNFEFHLSQLSVKRNIHKNRMEIILDALAMLDDGQIPKLGPESAAPADAAPRAEKEGASQVIKGPLVDYMVVVDEESFSDGMEIVKEGKHGNWMWVIMEGVAEIVKRSPRGDIPIVRIGNGGFIGSLSSFSMAGGLRSATSIAKGEVQLGVLDCQKLAAEYSRMPPALRCVLVAIDKRLKQITQTAAEIMGDGNDFAKLIAHKDVLAQNADEAECIFLIENGEATVVRKTASGNLPLAVMGKGDFIGPVHFANLGHEPHGTTLYATADIELKPLDIGQLKADYDQLSTTFKNITHHIANCLTVTTRLAYNWMKRKT